MKCGEGKWTKATLLTIGFLPGRGTWKAYIWILGMGKSCEAEKPNATLQLSSLCSEGSRDLPFTHL
jgi:hypothetical protein